VQANELPKGVWKRVLISLGHEPWWAEVYSSIATILWGITVWTNLIDLTKSVWGMVAISCGMTQLVAVLINFRLIRWVACLFCVGFWSLLTNTVWASGYQGPGLAVYAAWILPSAGSILRLLRRP
jgi:hypothetical protein